MDNATVAHRWANQIENKRTKRIEGSSSNGNLYFNDKTIDSFHHNFQCHKKGLSIVESYRIVESFLG